MKLLLLIGGFPLLMFVAFALKVAYLECTGRWSVRQGFEIESQERFEAVNEELQSSNGLNNQTNRAQRIE